MYTWSDENTAKLYLDAMLSLSNQSVKIHNDKVALANYSGAISTLNSLDSIMDSLLTVEKNFQQLNGYHKEYLTGMVSGLKCFARILQGDKIPYNTSIDIIQQVPTKFIEDDNIKLLEEKLNKSLSEIGYKGSVKDQIKEFLQKNTIAHDNVVNTAKSFLNKSRVATENKVIKLPEGEKIEDVYGVKEVFWSGFSRYIKDYAGDLSFNIERPWSIPTFVSVLTHEGYPGHQTFYSLWDKYYRDETMPLEASFYFINTPTNALFEGAPETGLHFLNWDGNDSDEFFTKEEKFNLIIGRDILDLQRIYQTNACYMANQLEEKEDVVLNYMTSSGMFNGVEAGNTYRFFTHPVQRTYYPSYYYGKILVQKAYDLFPENRRSEFFDILYKQPHTTNTFISAISKALNVDYKPF